MALTVLITRDVEDRYRGFLSSAMLELSPGVYASPALNARARERIWEVVSDWHARLGCGSLLMIYPDSQSAGGMAVRSLGVTPRQAVKIDGVLLSVRVSARDPPEHL